MLVETAAPTLLSIDNLCHRYHDKPVLEQVSLHVRQGEFLSILGPSGAGKTTLLRSIAGFANPTIGTITIANQAVLQAGKTLVAAEHRQVGYVLQDYALFPHLTVAENIEFGLIGKSPKQKRRERVNELLKMINMESYAAHMPSNLSGGQQQRVALARALAPKPKLLLLDEPFANIDVTLRLSLGTALQRLVQSEQVTVILVTHDHHEAFSLADRVAVITPHSSHGATIVQCDTPDNVYHQPSNITVAQLTGAISLLPATGQGLTASCSYGQVKLLAPFTKEGTLLLRPEMVKFTPKSDGPIRIINRLCRGYCCRIICEDTEGQQIYADVPVMSIKLGTRGQLSLPGEYWMV